LDRFAQSFIEQLAGYHPKIALSHAVEFLPPGPQSDQAIVRATMHWAAKKPEAALQWSLETFDDPGRAVDLASQISVPERREREMIWHGREWMKKSP